jgi:hypothetical protein
MKRTHSETQFTVFAWDELSEFQNTNRIVQIEKVEEGFFVEYQKIPTEGELFITPDEFRKLVEQSVTLPKG